MPNERTSPQSGRKYNQKMKPYLVYQYLLRKTDENNTVTAEQICGFLQELGIDAERRSIYKDIEAINDALWLLEYQDDLDLSDGFDIALEEAKEDGTYEQAILYDSHRKGFYVTRRKYEASEIRLIAECIYSSKYISQSEAERLVEIMKEFVSDDQAAEFRTDAFVTNRVRTLNKNTLRNVTAIYDAMSKSMYGEKHVPEKISFQYMKYNIANLDRQTERRKGATYIVSPYKLIINDGYYYLLAYDDQKKSMMTYRVDRMKGLKAIGIPREGEEEFKKISLETYTQRTFSMFNGEKQHVRLRFRASLLDAVIERFGTTSASYMKNDENHFTVSTDIEISNPFFGWLCGFGSGVRIEAPEALKTQFVAYLDKIKSYY